MVIAIDGPAGAGKSTVARGLAKRLGFVYLNSGAMYRAVALKALESSADLDDGEAIARLASSMDLVLDESGEGNYGVELDGRDVGERIKEPDVSRASSRVAVHEKVREELVGRQRELLATGDHVVEGRDIGTVVAPDAELKIFLTADEETRAARRAAEFADRGVETNDSRVLEEISNRDRVDSTRTASPLREAEHAVVIDTSKMEISQVVDRIVSLVDSDKSRNSE